MGIGKFMKQEERSMLDVRGRIGIYGGTFDPIHFGHLNLAIQMREIHGLSEIWFCPVQISPHKLDTLPPTPIAHRMNMLKLAIDHVPHFQVTDVEAKRPGPSFTVETLQELFEIESRKAKPHQFCLVMGDDAIPGFFRWHQPEKIVKMVPILIGRRLPEPIHWDKLHGDKKIGESLMKGLTETRLVDISATEIRERLKQGLYCGHLLPEKVVDYILKNDLY